MSAEGTGERRPQGSSVVKSNDPRDWGWDDYNAVFFGWERGVPVFHGFGDGKNDDPDVSADYTRCGLVVARYHYVTKRLDEPGTWLPLRHAVKFGRPCGNCFPRQTQATAKRSLPSPPFGASAGAGTP